MLSCISSKIAVYLTPAFPFFVYLAVLLLARFRWNRWLALALAVPAAVFVASTPVACLVGRATRYAVFGSALLLCGSRGIDSNRIACAILPLPSEKLPSVYPYHRHWLVYSCLLPEAGGFLRSTAGWDLPICATKPCRWLRRNNFRAISPMA